VTTQSLTFIEKYSVPLKTNGNPILFKTLIDVFFKGFSLDENELVCFLSYDEKTSKFTILRKKQIIEVLFRKDSAVNCHFGYYFEEIV
jgi:hypothetical protein